MNIDVDKQLRQILKGKPPRSSVLNMIPLASDIFMQWTSDSFLKFQFINAGTQPIFDNPSHIGTYSAQFSMKTATLSPKDKDV